MNIARKQGILEFKDVPETGLDKLKGASMGKRRNGERYLQELSG